MTKWHTISARFAEEEVKIIDEFATKLGLNRSEIVKRSVISFLIVDNIFNLVHNFDAKTRKNLEEFVSNIFTDDFVNMPNYVMKIFQKDNKEYLRTLENGINDINRKTDSFFKHNPRGPPKKNIRKRGRPKDTGSD